MRKGKFWHWSKKQIKRLDKDFVFDRDQPEVLCDLLEEAAMRRGAVLYDTELELQEEITVNGTHELRYSCMIVYGHKRKDKFILSEASIQYKHIK